MRGVRPIVTVLAATLATAPLAVPSAWAQSNPSADQIINQLKPKGSSLLGATRGIRPVPGAATDTPTPPSRTTSYAAVPSKAHQARMTASAAPEATTNEAPSVSMTVEFASGSAELTPAAMTTLDELGKALSSDALSAYRFRIEGHTDTVGTPDHNKALSEQRADAVASYIGRKFGVAADRLTAVGLGSSHLAVPTGDQVPEARNRRVQVINLGA
jgi:outer membrane protein OmpA-like peptidoglycan-associated protein